MRLLPFSPRQQHDCQDNTGDWTKAHMLKTAKGLGPTFYTV
jgi:hypothetical protein